MVSNKARIFRSTALIVLVLATTSVRASANDVTPGMDLRDAMWLVKRCILQVTAFKDPRPYENKELRAQDKLEYVGITDDARLHALRRFIVRNNEYGVQSIWGFRRPETTARPYLLANSALSKMEKGWTIEQLAREVAGSAGLPFLTYAKASQIVANCRDHATPAVATTPTPTPTPTPSPSASPTPVPPMPIESSLNKNKFKSCLNDGELGIGSAGLTDGEGDFYPYVAKYLANEIGAMLKGEKVTYTDIVNLIRDKARVDLSAELTAPIIARNWILMRTAPGCDKRSFVIGTYCLPGFYKRDTKNIWIDINPDTLPTAVSSYRRNEKAESLSLPPLTAVPATQETKISDLINAVKLRLEGKTR